MATDVEIGGNLTRVRAGMSQKDLAEAMRKKGFRWSQATVWAVEKGERPLRLAEAEAIGQVLDVQFHLLLRSSTEVSLVYQFRELSELFDEIDGLAYRSFEIQRRLAVLVDLNPSAWGTDDDEIDTLTRNAVDAAVEGFVRGEAHYRAALEVVQFEGDTPAAPNGRATTAFFDRAHGRIEEERARRHAAKRVNKEKQDALDQAAQ